MKINVKKLYPLIGLGIAVGLVLLVSRKKTQGGGDDEVVPVTPEDEGGITPEQKKIDPTLNSILISKDANTLIKGKKLYTKVANVKARTQAGVNDGVINNLYGTLSNAGTFVGTAISVVNDIGKTNNPITNKTYKWVKTQLSKEGYEAVQANRSFLTRDLFAPSNFPIVYFREDTIKL
jgi:hypothetical protein